MRTLLICHEDAALDREGLARWLGSFSTFTGAVVIREPGGRLRKRISREVKRVGLWRFLDVLAFRAYHRFAHAADDRRWEARELARLRSVYPRDPSAPEIIVSSPNAAEAQQFIASQQPDLVIARCKTLLAERIFSIPRLGTFVMHPGICPEYRNAHGCFWALTRRDFDRVGMTLLRVDPGIDTGPVFLHASYAFDEVEESHSVIQYRTVTENLDVIADVLTALARGEDVQTVPIEGRESAVWGQPQLTAYLRWKREARRRSHARRIPALS